jgi:DNA-binding response OmpR family regulator
VETILVVEDDGAVRAVLAEMLVGHGYRVLAAGDADEAAALLNGHRVDLVVLDLMLPRAEADLPALLQTARYVYISGFPADQLPRALPFGSTFVQKPFSSDELLTAVRLALAAGT